MGALAIEVIEGTDAGQRTTLDRPLVIGREIAGLDLKLDDPEVSRRHARIKPSGSAAMIEDLGSRNGTYVNEQAVEEKREIADGDRIRVGLTVLQLRTEEAVAHQPSAVRPSPAITSIGRDVLQPAAESELAEGEGASANSPAALLIPESEPAYISQSAVERGGTEELVPGSGQEDLAHLIDTQVKRRTNIAAFAVLAIAALAVLIVLGSG